MKAKTLKKIAKRTNRIKRNVEQAIANKPPKKQKLVYKEKEFIMYVLWKAMPPLMRGQDERGLRAAGIEEEAIDLTRIKTQAEFAETYGLKTGTLVEWNKKIDDNKLLEIHDKEMQSLTRNIDLAFYKQTILNADAPRVALWHRLFGKLKGIEDPPVPPTTINQHFTQNIINLGKEYDDKLEQEYREAIQVEVHGPERIRADTTSQGRNGEEDSDGRGSEKQNSKRRGALNG